VQSATLKITTSSNALSGGSVSIFRLLEDWTEGTADGTPGVANYNQRKTSTNWAGAGATGASRASTASATFTPNQTNKTFSVTLPNSLVQIWISNPTQNFGVVMSCSFNQDVAFFTRAASSASQRPQLVITYTN
jgi:hypothetical protein